jgi:hypothetical protein
MFKKIIILSIIAVSLNASMVFEKPAKKKEVSVKQEKKQTKNYKIKPISVKGIKYEKGYLPYSIYNTDKEAYKAYVKKLNLPNITIKNLFNSVKTKDSILLSAFAYDYGYKRPDLAENFYQYLPKLGKKYTMSMKILLADYYLRTGRLDKIETLLNKSECVAYISEKDRCFYYLGLIPYLKDGNNKNHLLNMAKDSIKKAKEIYYSK